MSLLSIPHRVKTIVLIYGIAVYIGAWQLLNMFASLFKRNHINYITKSAECRRKVAVVTGGSSGIGLSTVRRLNKQNFYVISIARDHQQTNKLKDVKKYDVDLSDFEALQLVIEEVRNSYETIDVLVNCAGIMFHHHQANDHGVEHHLAVNYLSHFILTMLLLPLMKNSSYATIVNVTSSTYAVNSLSFSENIFKVDAKNFCRYEWYAASKHAMLLFTMKLRKILQSEGCNHVKVVAYDPGTVKTNLFQYSDFLTNLIITWFGKIFLQPPTAAANEISEIVASADAKVLYCSWKQRYVDLADQARLSSKFQDELYNTSCKFLQSSLIYSLY